VSSPELQRENDSCCCTVTPFGTNRHVINGHRTVEVAAIGRRKAVDAQNCIIIIIIFLPRPYRAVYYTKTTTANCEPDCDSRSSVAAAATVENNIILLMNRNPILAVSRFAFRVIKN